MILKKYMRIILLNDLFYKNSWNYGNFKISFKIFWKLFLYKIELGKGKGNLIYLVKENVFSGGVVWL